jgi:hypothetical protein
MHTSYWNADLILKSKLKGGLGAGCISIFRYGGFHRFISIMTGWEKKNKIVF